MTPEPLPEAGVADVPFGRRGTGERYGPPVTDAYAKYDDELRAWADDHQLPLFTEYKDEPVRSFQIVGSTGSECQIWLDQDGSVHVWDYKKRGTQFRDGRLRDRLDAALGAARAWAERSA
jgi:hypothetical protein